MQLQPYLFFNGRSEEAIEFYKKAVGAKINRIMRFKESPDQSMVDPKTVEKVMHADINVGGTNVLLSGGRCQGDLKFEGFALTIYAKDDADAQKLFKSLSDGGQVQMPLTRAFFASSFGMVADRFGVGWMILAGPK